MSAIKSSNEPAGPQDHPCCPAQGAQPHSLPRPCVPGAAEAARHYRVDRPSGRQHRPHRGDPERQIPVPSRHSRPGGRDYGVQGRGDRLEVVAAQARSGRDHPRGQEFQGGDCRTGRPGGLVHPDPQHERDRRLGHGNAHARRQPPLHDLHQWRSPVRLRQGRPNPAGYSHRVRRHRPIHLGDRGPRPQVQPGRAAHW